MQSKTASFIEQTANISSGFLISLLVWIFVVAPLYDIPVAYASSFQITCIFTVTSFIRGYFWRRSFTRWFNKSIHKWQNR